MRGKKLDPARPLSVVAGRMLAGALTLACWATLGASASLAQQDKPRLVFSDAPLQKTPLGEVKNPLWSALNAPGKKSLWLRPNAEQRLYLYVQNPTNKELKDVEVELVADGKPVPGGKAILPSVPAGEARQARFAPEAPPAKEKPAKEPAKAAAPAWAELPGRSFEVRLLRQKEELDKRTIFVRILAPRDYAVAAGKFDNQTKQLTVAVEGNEYFAGPPGVVTMTVLVPGTRIKTSTLRGTLRQGQGAALKSELQFEGAAKDRKGLVYVTVDGYERAFAFDAPLEGSATSGDVTLPPRGDRTVHIEAAPFSVPDPKYAVRLGVDNLSHSPRDEEAKAAKLELDLGDKVGGEFQAQDTQVLAGPRQEFIRIACGAPDGAVLFQTEVRDWVTAFDASGTQGRRYLRARLLQDDKNPLELARAETPVVFDGTPAEILTFDVPPRKGPGGEPPDRAIIRGDPLEVEAKVADPESGVRHVLFFVGKAPPEGKFPPGAVTAEGRTDDPDKAEPTFFASLPAPTAKAGTLELGVQVTNGAGTKSFGTITVKLIDVPAGGFGAKGSKLSGSVVLGGVPQKNLAVVLKDAKGEIKDTAATDAKGKFVFQNVAPGAYRVSSRRALAGAVSKGETLVQVLEGKDKTGVEIQLLRK